ncbi:unnamed protein product [Mytilus edulis]|uniref:Uncharacterized protein n=1 Tax=Mytilus edulis TaxID=6550 RepID=A0A8S3Q121_MYTED|nr:unnamed protein product [Mytilus edulis]
MAASTTNGTSSKDLSHLPDISFAFVEEFIRKHSQSSGKEQMTKGFKYYSEEYVHSVSGKILLKHLYHRRGSSTRPVIKWRKPDSIVVQDYDREDPQRATNGIKSTLYNPIPGNEAINLNDLLVQVKDMDILFDTMVSEHRTEVVQTEFGKFLKEAFSVINKTGK